MADDVLYHVSNGIVVNVFYNRTVWPARHDAITPAELNEEPVPMSGAFLNALMFGEYAPHHTYESVFAEWDPSAVERDWCEEMWYMLQADFALVDHFDFPIEDRSMCIGDVVTIDRIDHGLDNHPIAAWIAVPDGFKPCPAFLERLK